MNWRPNPPLPPHGAARRRPAPPQPMRPMNGAGGHDSGRFPIKKLVTDEEIRSERARKIRRFAIIGGGVTAAALLFVAFRIVDHSFNGCTFSRSGRRAVEAIQEHRDRETGAPLGDRFDHSGFSCMDTVKPKGTLVAWHDGSQAIVWFVDPRGIPFNVNLLSQAWTPDLPPGPGFTPEQIRRVEGSDDE